LLLNSQANVFIYKGPENSEINATILTKSIAISPEIKPNKEYGDFELTATQ